MRVRLTAAARRDIQEIGDFIRRDNRARADSFVRELLERCEALAASPNRYRVAINRRGLALRLCHHHKYLIFYSAHPDEVAIVRVIHSARDYVRLLFPED